MALLLTTSAMGAVSGATWSGVLSDGAGKRVSLAVVKLHSTAGSRNYSANTSADGKFALAEIAAGTYELSVKVGDKEWRAAASLLVKDASVLTAALQLSSQGQEVRVVTSGVETSAQGTGGEHLSSAEVSSLPLNVRDFSKLLLLAAGTMTDANGARGNRFSPRAKPRMFRQILRSICRDFRMI